MIPFISPFLCSAILSTPPPDHAEVPPLEPLTTVAASMPLSSTPTLWQDDGEEKTFSYTFIELGVTTIDVDAIDDIDVDIDEDVDTYYGRAQLALFKFLYFFVGYENQDFDIEDTSSDVIRLGIGAYRSLNPKLDLFGDVAWLYSDLSSDVDDLDDDDNGYEIRAGLRWMVLDWDGGGLELDGNGTWISMDNRIGSDDEVFGWEVGGRVHFLRLFSLGASYMDLEDDDQVSMNARLSF